MALNSLRNNERSDASWGLLPRVAIAQSRARSDRDEMMSHFGPVPPEPRGLVREEELALPQETPALIELPGVGLGGVMFGCHQGSKSSPWGAAGTDAAGRTGGRVRLVSPAALAGA